ncbi:Vps5-domain-containing protein [Marasmius fiardii PR-910]|nr:Vps5-domain-containing protein [Marasmius fiardii PR-910]
MDSFDDLLAPSRNMLEDNPFSDPFSKRSGSPDPWANPYSHHDQDIYSSPFSVVSQDDSTTTSPVAETPHSRTTSEVRTEESDHAPVPDAIQNTSDPLDSAQLSEEGEEKPATPAPLSAGFRESTDIDSGQNVSDTVRHKPQESTIVPPLNGDRVDKGVLETEKRDVDSVEDISTLDHPATKEKSPGTRLSTPNHSESHPQSTTSSPSAAHAPVARETATSPSTSWNPLDRPSHDITQSFSNLNFGGESLNGSSGGWAASSEPESWGNEPQPVVSRLPSDEDSDDDKPIGQTMNKRLSLQSNPAVPVMQKPSSSVRPDLRPVFVITVDDPQKVGDPIRSFTMYTVHTRTTSPLFQKSAFSVLRRYSDFLWLYETLSNNNPGVVVPPVPEKNSFGRFDDQFVKQRRFALEKCIQKIANHPVLGKDPDLKLFLESDTFSLDIKHRKAEIAHERGGLMASIGQTITGPRFHESDEWFDRQKAYLDSLESQLRGLTKAIDMVAKQRAEQSTATLEFANSLSELASADVGKQLVLSLSGLSEVERKAHDLQVTQSDQDMVTFMGTVDEYARLINSVRLAFSSRIRVYHSWRNAESELQRVKVNHEKNRAQGRIPTDRLGYSLSQIADAERRAADAKLEFEQVSRLVKSEVARFEQERIEDFKDSLHSFLEGMISRQKELIGQWETYQQMLLKRAGVVNATPTIAIAPPQPALRSAE